MKTNIGITKPNATKIVQILSHYLADTYYVYLKTHSFHWNVTGMNFQSLHSLFDVQYNALFASLDEIAERIRALGDFVPGSFAELKELTCIKECKTILKDKEMVKNLLDDHETIVRHLREWIEEVNEAGDVGTGDFLTARIEEHEKTAWMLRAHLD